MKSIVIKPFDNKDFEKAFSLLTEFGKEPKLHALKDDEIGFAFLMNVVDTTKEVAGKGIIKKAGH